MLPKFTAALLVVLAIIIGVVLADDLPRPVDARDSDDVSDDLPQPFNKRPNNSNKYFSYEIPMWSQYIHFIPGTDFCADWHHAVDTVVKPSAITFKKMGCKVVDHKFHVAVVFASIAHHHAHIYSYTGPVGYSIPGITWVYPKHDAYDFEGGGCHKVVRAWCLDKEVRPGPVDLGD